jgi:hypothetical protein
VLADEWSIELVVEREAASAIEHVALGNGVGALPAGQAFPPRGDLTEDMLAEVTEQ